jgi:Predicted permease
VSVSSSSTQKAIILWTISMVALAVVVLWSAFLVRDVLLLIYVSGLLAIGFSPIVRIIERQKVLPIGTRRFPRWLAILILYIVILGTLTGIGFMIVPPLIDQSHQLWEARTSMFDRAQDFLMQKGLLKEHISLLAAIERAPGTNSQAVGTVMGAVIGLAGGLFGLLTILILTFYILVDADSLRNSMLRLFPARDRPRVADRKSVV